MVLELRDYQEECVARHYDFFARESEGNPLFVVPTGGGKSLILSEFVKRSVLAWPGTRFLVVTHVKELIRQNYEEFVGQWGDGHGFPPAGIYSAGVGRRDAAARVLFAGIQSIYDKACALGSFDLVLIDEAHLVPKRGMGRYRAYLDDLREVNPGVRVCGYTATHFRLDGGYLHRGDGRIFTDVAYEVPLELLIERGFLVPLVAKRPEHAIDIDGVGVAAGDFKRGELETAARADGCVEAAVEEVIRVAAVDGRKSWLFFATGIDHAKDVVDELEASGVRAIAVFGHTPKEVRDRVVADFKAGEITALVNVGVLTTGFNAPRCDLMAVMRPTHSASLYVQMMGRGMRTFPGKKDCLVLDYGRNVERHGPVNRVRPSHRREADDEEKPPPPMKVCPTCSTILLLGTATCPECGHEWPAAAMRREHARVASWLSPVDMDADKPKTYDVDSWHFRRHEKEGKPDSLRVDHMCGVKTVSEWVCLEHGGFAGRKATRWWTGHRGLPPIPTTIEEALGRAEELAMPLAIEVTVDDDDFERVSATLMTRGRP